MASRKSEKPFCYLKILRKQQASSSIGRAAVSKTAGWGFDSLLACHLKQIKVALLLLVDYELQN